MAVKLWRALQVKFNLMKVYGENTITFQEFIF
jgi:hypothetical protein